MKRRFSTTDAINKSGEFIKVTHAKQQLHVIKL